MVWEGTWEGCTSRWIRWVDTAGVLLPTGAEGAARATERAERLAARLRALGVDPDTA